MNNQYSVIQITALNEKTISVLLSDDLAYDVDREAFENYIAPTGEYEFNMAVVGDNYKEELRLVSMPIAEYWEEFKTNDKPHIADLNDFIAHSKSTQLDIDVVRAKENMIDTIHHYDIDYSKLYSNIDAYVTAIKNQITYQNK